MNNLIIDVGIIKKKEREGGRTKKNDCEATKNYFPLSWCVHIERNFTCQVQLNSNATWSTLENILLHLSIASNYQLWWVL